MKKVYCITISSHVKNDEEELLKPFYSSRKKAEIAKAEIEAKINLCDEWRQQWIEFNKQYCEDHPHPNYPRPYDSNDIECQLWQKQFDHASDSFMKTVYGDLTQEEIIEIESLRLHGKHVKIKTCSLI